MKRWQDNNGTSRKAWRAVAGGAGVAAALAAVLVWVSGQWGETPEAVVGIPAAGQVPASAVDDSAAQQSASAPSAGVPVKSSPMPSAGGPLAESAPTPSADDSAADTPTPSAAPETVERMKQALQQIKSASMPPSEAAIDGKRERLLVTRRPGMAEMRGGAFTLLAAMQEVEISHLGALDITIVEVPVGWDLDHLRKIIAEDPSVESASRDSVVQARGRVVPNDPDFGIQHNLNQSGDVDVDAPEAWAYTTGSEEVVVAVIDSGIDYSHLDLLPNLWVNSSEIANNNIDDDGNGYVDDIYGVNATIEGVADIRRGDPWDDTGHGTGVASVIGARGNNNALLAGINWNVRIMSIKAIESDNRGLSSYIITGIDYIVKMRRERNINIKVVNLSIGFTVNLKEDCPRVSALLSLYRSIARLGEEDILFVTSSGNTGRDIDLPGQPTDAPACFDHDHLIAVASQTVRGRQVIGNYGITSVDLTAPGSEIPTAGIPSLYAWRPQSRKGSPDSGVKIFPDGPDSTESAADAARWTADPPWGRTTEQKVGGLYSWTDSPRSAGNPGGLYAGDQNISLTSPPIDLSASTPGEVWLFLRADIRTALEYRFGSNVNVPCRFCDVLYLEMSRNSTMNWTTREAWSGFNGWREMSVAIPAWGYKRDFRFRFRLDTNAATNHDGVYIDNIRIVSHDTGADTTSSRSGTSYASPHVAGAAALLWAHRPGLSVGEVRAALLDNVDKFAGFRVASGGALNIANALFSVTTPSLRIHASQTTVMEGGDGHLEVSLTREPRGTPDRVVVRSTTATAGRITGINPGALTFTRENWHLPQRIDFGTLVGVFPGGPVETLQLSVDTAQSDPAYAAVSRSVTVQVDVERGIYIHASQTTVAEGASGYLDVSLTRAPPDAGRNVILRVNADNPRIIEPSRFPVFTSGNWHEEQRFVFGVSEDEIVQPTTVTEFLQISAFDTSDPAWVAVSRSVAVQIINDDPWAVLGGSPLMLTVDEGSSATVGLVFNPLPQDVSMTITVRNHLAGANPDDYVTPAVIRAAAGSTGTRFTVRITDDEETETMETIILQIAPSSPDVLGTEAMTVIVAIPANDPVATLAVSPNLLAEGGSAVVTVRLNIPVSSTVMFNINADPENPARYSLANPLTVTRGTTHGSVVLSAPDNGVQEESQTVTLTFTQTSGSDVPVIRGNPSTAQLRIVDDLLLMRLRVFLEGAVSTDGRSTTAPDPP